MPEILLTSLADAMGGPVPADAVLTATATRSRTTGAVVIANRAVTVRLVAGVPTEPLILDASGPDWCWHLRLVFPAVGVRIDRWVVVPDGGSVEWADLVDVDPKTLVPSEGAVPAWTAAVGQVAAALADTVAARDAAAVSAGQADTRATDAEGDRILAEGARGVAVDAAAAAGVSEGVAVGSASAAASSATAAEAAKLAAQAVGTTNDTVMAAVAATPTSAFSTQLNATFAARSTVDLRAFLTQGETLPTNKESNVGVVLQRAVDAVNNALAFAGPKTIKVPAGQYKLTTPVVWRSGVGLAGESRSTTTFFPEGSAQLAAMANLDFTGTMDDVEFRDFTIDCIGQESAPGATIKGLSLRYLNRALIARVTVKDSWGTGFGNDFSQDTTYVDCIAIRCGRGGTYTWGAGAGFGIGVGMFERESVTFTNCWALDNHSSGFFFERLASMLDQKDGRGYTLIGCTARGNFTGVNDAGVHGLIVSGCHFTDNTMAGYCLSGSAPNGEPRSGGKDGNVSGCVITGNGSEAGGAGILLRHAGTGGYTFENNEIADNIGAGVSSPSTARLGTGWRFTHNRIERNHGRGFDIEAPLLDRWDVRDNTVRENGLAHPSDLLDGMRFAGDMVNPRIEGNTVEGHFGAGLHLPGADTIAVAPAISGNALTENAGGALLRDKAVSDTTFITGNREGAAFATLTNLAAEMTDASGVTADGNVTGITWMSGEGGFVRATTINTNSAGLKVFSQSATPAFGGKCWTFSAWVRISNTAAVLKPFVRAYGTSSFARTWGTTGFRATGGWQRISITVATPSAVNRLDFTVGADIPSAGTDIDVRRVLVTEGVTRWPWFSGTLTIGDEPEPDPDPEPGPFELYTSDSFTGTPGPMNPRDTDAALGGDPVAWEFASALNRFDITGNGTLGAGSEPASATLGLPTGFAGAGMSIKVVAGGDATTVADFFSNRTALNSATHAIGARVSQSSGELAARIRTITDGTVALDGQSFPVVPGDTVWVGVTNASTGDVQLRVNGETKRTITYAAAIPTQYAVLTCGDATGSAWELDDVIVEQASA